MGISLATRLLFPNMKGMSLEITEELIARQPPEAQAIIRALGASQPTKRYSGASIALIVSASARL